MSIKLTSSEKKSSELNNELFFNYTNKIEKNVEFNEEGGILEVKLKDTHCTAKFGKHPEQTMNINTIKIVRGYINNYESVGGNEDGECIITYIPSATTFSEYGQVCIKLKGLDNEDGRINKFFANMLDSNNDIKSGHQNTINLDHLIPNGTKFFYASTDDTVLDNVGKRSNVILFDDYNIVYCPKKLLEKLTKQSPSSPELSVSSLTINHSGSVNDNEEFITECTPIGADVDTQDWAKPAKNTIFSFFADPSSNNIAWKKIGAGEFFQFGPDSYIDKDGNEGNDLIIYIAFHFIASILIIIILLALVNLTVPVSEYYKEGVKAGEAQTLGRDK